jgi:hypothetical protein
MIERLLDRLFRREEIDGNDRCPVYLIRWTIFQPRRLRKFWRGFGIYLHKFVGDDWSLDLHDHPKRFISIGLKGAYREATPIAPHERGIAALYTGLTWKTFRAPWLRTFPANHVHRIELLEDRRPCWTFVIVLTHVREWGFWHRGAFIHWRQYVHSDNTIATSRRSCQ